MTESEWLTGTDSEQMVEYWGEPYPERKSRLLMLACCLLQKRYFAHVDVRAAVKALKRHYADPLAPDQPFEGRELRALHTRIERCIDADRTYGRVYNVALAVWTAMEPASTSAKRRLAPFGVKYCLEHAAVNAKVATIPSRV